MKFPNKKILHLFVLVHYNFITNTGIELSTNIQTFRPGLNISRRTLGVTIERNEVKY